MKKRLDSISALFLSPWWLMALLVLPAFGLAMILLKQSPPAQTLIFANNLLLLAVLILRLSAFAMRAGSGLRYSAQRGLFSRGKKLEMNMSSDDALELKEALSALGYESGNAGAYMEAREPGFWASPLVHACIILIILVGTYDNMTYISGTISNGIGHPIPLYNDSFTSGVLASKRGLPYKMKILEQYSPTGGNRGGEAFVSLQDMDGKELVRKRLAPGNRLSHDGFYIEFLDTVYDAWLVILDGRLSLVGKMARLGPDKGMESGYIFHGSLEEPKHDLKADVWLNPETRFLMVSATRDGKTILDKVVVPFGNGVNTVHHGEITTKIAGLGTWSQFRVQRERHLGLIKFLAALVVIILGFRLFIRPRRVWFTDEGGMVHVRATRPAEILSAMKRQLSSA